MRHRTWALSLALTCGCVTSGSMNGAPLVCSDLSDMAVGPHVEIRLMVLYTDLAASKSTDIEGDIATAVDDANLAYYDSGIPIDLVLAFTKQVPGPASEQTTPLGTVVGLFQGGGIGNAPKLRDDNHADIAGLIAEVDGGISYENMLIPALGFAPKAFFLAGRGSLGFLTLTHEIGHLLGAVHRRPVAAADLPRYSYAFPHTCPTCSLSGGIGYTIMGPSTGRVPLFSNPDLVFSGGPLGTATTGVDPEDNRRTLTNTAPIVATFRLTPAWFVATGGYAPWSEKRPADDQLPSLAFADFDGDGLTDVFKIDPATKDWMISSAGMGPWVKIGNDALGTPLSSLRFGDFDHDGKADAFRSDVSTKTWYVSWKSTGTWAVLNGPLGVLAVPPEQLLFGDFDGDKWTDVLIVNHLTGEWWLSSAGSKVPVLRSSAVGNVKFPASELRVGDFDGDGYTDVFRVDASAQTWLWSKSASDPWATLNGPDAELAVPVSQIGIGDFNGDGKSDVMVTTGAAWGVAWAGAGKLEFIKLSCRMMDGLAFGDFDGDRVTDVFRTGIRP